MDAIETKALALLADILPENAYRAPDQFIDKRLMWNALCRAIEQHEAFRQEVSHAVEVSMHLGVDPLARERLSRFIIPKPVDPLVEAMTDCLGRQSGQGEADDLRAEKRIGVKMQIVKITHMEEVVE